MLSLSLAVLVVTAYLPALRCGFVNYDDDVYVCQNTHVLRGLNWETSKWAFTNIEAGFWHPLTWLSLLLDCQLYGPRPWGYHLTNLLLHISSTVLLFVVLRRMTDALWQSAFAAALFGLHPLHVESVAWIAERKDVLSTFFWMLTLLLYVRYAQQVRNHNPAAKWSYGLALAVFVCGLMSKTMVVTLPLVLLLLDWWPLQRLQVQRQQADLRRFSPLLWEKLPFLVPAIVLGGVTVYSERAVGALLPTTSHSLAERFANAAISYCVYLGQTLWPANLAVFYPYPAQIPYGQAACGGLLLAAVSLWVMRAARTEPYLVTGWAWYLITLLPVIGLVQIGGFARADRYTYIPLVGIFLLLIWGASRLAGRFQKVKCWLACAAAGLLMLCLGQVHRQLSHWKDGVSLFGHAVAVTVNNSMARNNFSAALIGQGRYEDALAQTLEAAQLAPKEVGPRVNQGLILMKLGRLDEALTQFQSAIQSGLKDPAAYRALGDALAAQGKAEQSVSAYHEALRLAPRDFVTRLNLGLALDTLGRPEQALSEFRAALDLHPSFPEARRELGILLARQGQPDAAAAELETAVRLNPQDAEARIRFADVLLGQGRLDAAESSYREAVRLAPRSPLAHHNLGVVLGMKQQREEALAEFREAVKLNPGYAEAQANLGMALLEQGRAADGLAALETAVKLNPDLAEAHRNLGRALTAQGRLDEAVSQFEHTLRLNPADPEAYCDLGVAQGRQGRLDQAIGSFREALRLKPDHPQARRNLQLALEKKGSGAP